MKEYTLIAAASVAAAVIVDLASGIRILRRKEYYVFLAVIFGFKLAVNGYLTAAPVVRYEPRFFLNFRIGSIPVEDFLFGFSMVTITIILWEYFKKKR